MKQKGFKMKRKELSKLLIILSASCYIFSSVTAYAAWSSTGKTDNFLSMASYKAEIQEEYDRPGHVDPSQEVSKIVNVKNNGSVSIFVRVAIEKEIGDVDSEGNFTKDESLDPEKILITYDDTMWKDGGDGYFYYMKELKAGKTTEVPLFKSFVLSKDVGNAYKKKEGHIIVKMESVQAEGGALSLWGKTAESLGLTYTEPETTSETTKVSFLGEKEGFDITTSQTDLFANFKNLMPGTSRTQEITLANKSSKKTHLSLAAEAVDQEKMSDKQLELVNKLLNEYGIIEISCDGSSLYKGPVSGTAAGTNMLKPISLCDLDAGTSKNMTVKLELSPDMDNQYMELLGKVRWVFTADGEDAKGSITPVKTGDISRKTMLISFAGASALLASGMWLARRKEEEEDA